MGVEFLCMVHFFKPLNKCLLFFVLFWQDFGRGPAFYTADRGQYGVIEYFFYNCLVYYYYGNGYIVMIYSFRKRKFAYVSAQ
jgi:hypothetical protein